MSRKRKEDLKRIKGLYKLVSIRGEPDICMYCGLPAGEKDHVPPISRVEAYRELYNLETEVYITVPCCARCNRLLGDSLQVDFLERIEVLRDRLAGTTKLFRGGAFTQDRIEFGEYSGTLLQEVVAHSRKQLRFRAEISFSEGVKSYLDMLMSVY